MQKRNSGAYPCAKENEREKKQNACAAFGRDAVCGLDDRLHQ